MQIANMFQVLCRYYTHRITDITKSTRATFGPVLNWYGFRDSRKPNRSGLVCDSTWYCVRVTGYDVRGRHGINYAYA